MGPVFSRRTNNLIDETDAATIATHTLQALSFEMKNDNFITTYPFQNLGERELGDIYRGDNPGLAAVTSRHVAGDTLALVVGIDIIGIS